jgi:phage gp16-like protein
MRSTNNNRNRYYALLQLGKKQLCMDENTYRDFLAVNGAKEKDGHISASTMHIGDLVKAVSVMQVLGFKPTRQSNVARMSNWRLPRIKKITALWCALADAGVVHDRGEAAMERFCVNLMRSDHLRWATTAELNQCIEALKSWAQRENVELHG